MPKPIDRMAATQSDRPIRLSDVAREAKVSLATASRAINGNTLISAETRKLVQATATRLGYRPDLLARGLSRRQTQTIGLVVADIRNQFFADVAHGVEEVLDSVGYIYLLGNLDGDPSRQRQLVRRLVDRRVDGLLITVPHDPEVLRLARPPIVAIDRTDGGVPYVGVDNVLGGRLAAEHLIQCGYERIAILLGDRRWTPVMDRHTGFLGALRSAGRTHAPRLEAVCPSFRYEEAHEQAKLLLDRGADAIFATDDVMAAAALGVAVQRGLSVPANVGVVGYDDTPLASWPTLNLTSVSQSTMVLGAKAAAMLLKRIEDPQGPVESVVLAPKLIVRGSTRAAAK